MDQTPQKIFAWRIKKNKDDQRNWQECQKHGCIAIDGRGIGDFNQYADLESIREAYRSIFKSSVNSNARKYPDACYQFSCLDECDTVIAVEDSPLGTKILAWGIVEAPYEYHEEYGQFSHTVPVTWNMLSNIVVQSKILNPKEFFAAVEHDVAKKILDILND